MCTHHANKVDSNLALPYPMEAFSHFLARGVEPTVFYRGISTHIEYSACRNRQLVAQNIHTCFLRVYQRKLHRKGFNGCVAAGAAYAYGNSSQVPYSEQFYAGGANSVRAFTVRSIGPGSYRAPANQINGYFDQTGTFIFLANTELRFPILGPLHGAVFLDAGNVWTLKNEKSRPGGQLRASTFLRDLALGTGAGLRFNISMLIIRADLGIGIHAPYDTGKRGYYNMESFKKSLAFHLAIGYPF